MGLHEGAHYSLLKKVAKNVNEIANDNSLLGKVAKNVNDISHDYFGGKIANKCQRDLGLHMLLFIKIAKNVNEIWGCTRFFRKVAKNVNEIWDRPANRKNDIQSTKLRKRAFGRPDLSTNRNKNIFIVH